VSLLVALSDDSYQLFAIVAMKVVISDQLSVAAITSQGGCLGRGVGCSSPLAVA